MYNYNLSISLWTSKSFKPNPKSTKLLDEETIANLLINFIEDVLNYSPNKNASLHKQSKIDSVTNLKDVFNFSFLTLTFVICIYEAPADLRSACLITLKNQLSCPRSREVSKLLTRLIGSNREEQWMRSINLAITNWIVELQAANQTLRTPSPLFSYERSTFGLWKVQLYCPVIAMETENSSSPLSDERLLFSLNYHQVEGVIQLNYQVMIREKWIEVIVNTDNVRYSTMIFSPQNLSLHGSRTAQYDFFHQILRKSTQ
ncbi:unnamed protein product [Ilex paraguariensis]|uniref:Uncharacterized protein n=1 Tax=Ilex paraguariensis TaxID=185542 RepID=A0ABC8QYT1_9AQUA